MGLFFNQNLIFQIYNTNPKFSLAHYNFNPKLIIRIFLKYHKLHWLTLYD